jgi:hypothetical protein
MPDVTEHARHAPSSLYLTVACPGWKRQASLMPPEPETEEQREGDAAHWVAAMAALRESPPVAGTKAPNGEEITDEMIEGAALWVEALEGYPVRVETRMQIPSVHPTDCWGTPDARQWNAERRRLRLADYKFGHGFVDEFENWQLLSYAVGTLDELFPGTWMTELLTIEMTVVQPRFYQAAPIRTWAIQTQGLLHYAARMRHAVNEADSENPRIMAGPHCLYCPARASCQVLARTTAAIIEFTARAAPMLNEPDQVGLELALIQDMKQRLKARETGLEAVAEAMLRSGKQVPNFGLERSYGRLEWVVDMDTAEGTARCAGKSLLKPPALITPTQAKQRKLLDPAVIAEYSDRPAGAMKLTRIDTTKLARKFQQ